MIKTRVISTLLWDGRSASVKGRGFKDRRNVGSMMQAVRLCERREVDELVILDVSAGGPRLSEVKEFTAHCFMPVAIGGGVGTVDHIAGLLRSGADKVVIGSSIFDTNLISEAAKRFGRQALVGAVDVKDGQVVTEAGTKNSGLAPLYVAKELQDAGVGEILLTSVDTEGSMEGYDTDLIAEVATGVSVPVVACGGAGSPAHLLQALRAGADAVAVGAMFLFTQETPASCKWALFENGFPVRL
jgi:cyclase